MNLREDIRKAFTRTAGVSTEAHAILGIVYHSPRGLEQFLDDVMTLIEAEYNNEQGLQD